MSTMSLCSIDCGFDPRAHDMPVAMGLDVDRVVTDDGIAERSPGAIQARLRQWGWDPCWHAALRPAPDHAGTWALTWDHTGRYHCTCTRQVHDEPTTVAGRALQERICAGDQVSQWLQRWIDLDGALRREVAAEWTPNGREIRYDRERDRFFVQPPTDNYWLERLTLDEARAVFPAD